MTPEALLQAAWQKKSSGTILPTSGGQWAEIVHPGVLNTSNGPDFLHAKVRMDGILLCGAIELHTKTRFWYEHGHHFDPAYNQVVLHVAGSDSGLEDVLKENGKMVETAVFPHVEVPEALAFPCKPFWSDLLKPAFDRQMASSKLKYLELMLARAAAWIPAGASPGNTLIHAVTGVSSEILGGTFNRELLTDFAKTILSGKPKPAVHAILSDQNTRSVRPKAHASVRVLHVQALHDALLTALPSEVILVDPAHSWARLWKRIHTRPGHSTLETLFQLAWLPALLLVAEMVSSTTWRNQIINTWDASDHPVPPFMKAQFRQAPVALTRNTGLVFQQKHLCGPKKCEQCAVFKNILLQGTTLA